MSEEELKAFRNLNTFSTKYIVNKKVSSENDIATMFVYIAKLEVELEHKDKEIERLNNIIKEVREYITSYESISTIQGLEDIEANKDLDEKTLNEMVRRYMIVHDKLLEILDKVNVKAIPPEVIGTNGEDGGLFDYGDKGE